MIVLYPTTATVFDILKSGDFVKCEVDIDGGDFTRYRRSLLRYFFLHNVILVMNLSSVITVRMRVVLYQLLVDSFIYVVVS